MLLIFPSIEIRSGECVQLVHGEPGSENLYSIDPVKMAVLWRGENAKTLHISDVDGVKTGRVHNWDIIERIVKAVDIPVQVGGGLRSYDDIKSLLEKGIYRIVIGTIAVHDQGLVEKLIQDFGARKIAISVEAFEGKIRTDGGATVHNVTPLSFILQMKKLGVSRIVYSEMSADGVTKVSNPASMKELAQRSGLRITAQGGINGYQELIRLQELEKFGVDSVIVGRALYENSFPCQRLWRLNEKELTDLGPTRRM
ncbi:MAG: 1-(5-phosphoribosyl)-5-[(5-phosphoribosylamino)methylideneamino] imidazole-4-carboxamide isomerase [Ignavibacteriales bacterium]|nr:1-(5-phosphoribosyl)-5-[(5-phosphoribosylamino)methylideneamino] imidazole-4-carboxamide isomerase [Ignavibacteriales bacterium]